MKNHYALSIYDNEGLLFHTYTFHILEEQQARDSKITYQRIYPTFTVVLYFIRVEVL
jgi:hypothetical protein